MITFKAHCDLTHNYWATVRLYDSRQAMHKGMASAGYQFTGAKAATVGARQRSSAKRLTGLVATIYLNTPDLGAEGAEIVAHEACHAAVEYFLRKGWPPVLLGASREVGVHLLEREYEERFAYAVGRLASNIHRGINEG